MLPLRLNRRFFTLLAVLMLCMSFLTITASAEAISMIIGALGSTISLKRYMKV